MLVLILIVLFVCIAMPLGFAWSTWRLDEPSLAGWLASVAYALVVTLVIFVVAPWSMGGYFTRLPLALLLAAAILLSWRRHVGRPWRVPEGRPLWRSHWSTLLPLAFFGAGAIYVLAGLLPPAEARSLGFPLQGGRFIVGQGGGNVLLNQHYSHPAQRHAVDIVALNAAGFRADGLYPDQPRRYAAFGAAVVSPCAGEVVALEDGLPDFAPPLADPENPAGNHVVIACEGLLVLLAHLRQDSVVVADGEMVKTGQLLGEIGNSGNTTEPHLHIHAVHEGTGDVFNGEAAAISFDGRDPVRNAVFDR